MTSKFVTAPGGGGGGAVAATITASRTNRMQFAPFIWLFVGPAMSFPSRSLRSSRWETLSSRNGLMHADLLLLLLLLLARSSRMQREFIVFNLPQKKRGE